MVQITWSQKDLVKGLVGGHFAFGLESNFFNLHRFIPQIALYYENEFDTFGRPNVAVFRVVIVDVEDRIMSTPKVRLDYYDKKFKCLLIDIEQMIMATGENLLVPILIGTRFDLVIDFGFPVFNLLVTKESSSGGCDFMMD
jgi:hypothetical protein